jgi:hypothetical protein
MDYIQGFTESHWMPSSDVHLCRIALAVTNVINFK